MPAEFNIIENEVKIVRRMARCPKCNKGFLVRYGNITLTTYPEQFPHKCTKCDYTTTISGEYFPSYGVKDGENYQRI